MHFIFPIYAHKSQASLSGTCCSLWIIADLSHLL